MSLINDALKRVKEVHANNPPSVPENLHLRPAEPDSRRKNGIGIVLPATAATVLLAALFSFWQLRGGSHTAALPQTELLVHAAAPHSAPAERGREMQAPPPVNAVSPQVSGTNLPAASPQTTAPTNAPAPTQDVAPKPAPIKLMAIVFNPAKPSAILDGKTVFVGDNVREFRVAAITSVSVTLAGSTQTNVLKLE